MTFFWFPKNWFRIISDIHYRPPLKINPGCMKNVEYKYMIIPANYWKWKYAKKPSVHTNFRSFLESFSLQMYIYFWSTKFRIFFNVLSVKNMKACRWTSFALLINKFNTGKTNNHNSYQVNKRPCPIVRGILKFLESITTNIYENIEIIVENHWRRNPKIS